MTSLSRELLDSIHEGIKQFRYKDIPTHKCPFDLLQYMEILWELKPKTIVEIGSGHGGSALWLAAMLPTYGLTDTKLYSFDRAPVQNIVDPRITYGKIDTQNPKEYLHRQLLESIEHPFLLIDDASHQYEHVLKILNFFHKWFHTGDYIIIEDGIVSALGREEEFNGGPLRAIGEFLAQHPDHYIIDQNRCNRYGAGVTWNPDGYIWCLGDPMIIPRFKS